MAGGSLVQLTTRAGGRTKMRKFKKGELKKALAATWKPRKSRIPVNVFGYGNKKMVKMEYVSTGVMETGATPTVNQLTGQTSFRLNNINLPYVGQASGFQLPQGYTQAAQAFKYFKVLGARVYAEFYDPSEDCQVGILPVSSGDVYDLQGVNVSFADMRKTGQIREVSATGDRRQVYKSYIKISSIEGLTPKQLNGDVSLYSIPFNATPATALTDENGTTGDLIKKRIPKIHFAVAANESGLTSKVSCKLKVTITYYTLCWGKTALPQSTSA